MGIKKKLFIGAGAIFIVGFYMWFNYAMPMTKYNIPVEKIYVINLDKSKDRLEAISKQLKAQNLEFTRFPALVGTDLKIEDENGHAFYGRDLKSKKEEFRIGEKYKIYCPSVTINYEYKPSLATAGGEPLSAGELGLYCSHFEIMRDTIRNRYKSVVVFEDDAVIPENFAEELKLIEQNMPNYKWFDVIFLGHYVGSTKWIDNKLKVKRILFNGVLDKITDYKEMNIGSTHAMLYSYRSAGRMLDNIKPNSGIDLDLYREANDGTLKTYKSRMMNVKPGAFVSTLGQMGRQVL